MGRIPTNTDKGQIYPGISKDRVKAFVDFNKSGVMMNPSKTGGGRSEAVWINGEQCDVPLGKVSEVPANVAELLESNKSQVEELDFQANAANPHAPDKSGRMAKKQYRYLNDYLVERV